MADKFIRIYIQNGSTVVLHNFDTVIDNTVEVANIGIVSDSMLLDEIICDKECFFW